MAELSPKQEQSIAEATARINLWHGAVRSGKTLSSIIAWLDFVARADYGPLAMLGNTKDTLERNVLDPMADLFSGDSSAVVHTRGANTAVILGRLVHCVGADNVRSERRVRGITLRGAYVDEATLMPEATWKMLLTRLSLPGAKLFATTNPDNPRHWLKGDYLENDRLDLAAWRFTIEDNPSLTPEFVEDLKQENVGLWYRRYILGEWVAAEGAIYPMLDLTPDGTGSHVVTELPTIGRWWIGIDHGFSNPTHAVLVGEGADRRLYVAAEWRDSGKTDSQLADGLEAWLDSACDGALAGPIDRVWVDPAAPSFVRELHRRGWPVRAARDEGVSLRVVDGIRDVASLLARRRLLFHERCRVTIDEHAGYTWDPEATKRGEDEPIKADDHAPDSVRYCCRMISTVWRRWTDLEVAA